MPSPRSSTFDSVPAPIDDLRRGAQAAGRLTRCVWRDGEIASGATPAGPAPAGERPRRLGEPARGRAARDLLPDSVRAHLVSDVPLGAFLSGGVDSSAVGSGLMAHASSRPVQTFSIGFDEPDFDKSWSMRGRVDASLSRRIITS